MSRILIATNIFPPLIGGPATFADRLAHVLAGRGHKVSVVCSSSAAVDPGDAARPFRVVRVSTANRYVYEVKIRASLVREFATHRRILVAGLESYVLDAVRLLPRRYILRVPGDTVWESARNYGATTSAFDDFQAAATVPAMVRGIADARRRYLARASTVVCPSDYLSGVVRRWPGTPQDLRTIRNGVAGQALTEPSTPRPRSGPLRVLFVGRLTNWKGVETLLLAARDLSGVDISIVGDGPELPMLEGLASQLAAGGSPLPVRFHGRQPEHEVQRFMHANDVLVLPSGYEGLSHTLLEALAVGLVPIASAIGGNQEVIGDGINGLLFPYADVIALRSCLERLRDDRELLGRLAGAARERAADFPFDRTVDAYAALIEEQGA